MYSYKDAGITRSLYYQLWAHRSGEQRSRRQASKKGRTTPFVEPELLCTDKHLKTPEMIDAAEYRFYETEQKTFIHLLPNCYELRNSRAHHHSLSSFFDRTVVILFKKSF